MSGVKPKQLWVSDEAQPQTYYVLTVGNDGTAQIVPARIEGTGAEAKVIGTGTVRTIKTSVMLDTWISTAHDPPPAPTWHARILSDDDEP